MSRTKPSSRTLAIKEVARQRQQFDTTFKHRKHGCLGSIKVAIAGASAWLSGAYGKTYCSQPDPWQGGPLLTQADCKVDHAFLNRNGKPFATTTQFSIGYRCKNTCSFDHDAETVWLPSAYKGHLGALAYCDELVAKDPCQKNFWINFVPRSDHNETYCVGSKDGWVGSNTYNGTGWLAKRALECQPTNTTMPPTTTMAITKATNATTAPTRAPTTSVWQNPTNWGHSIGIGAGMIAWVMPAFVGICVAAYCRGKRARPSTPPNSVAPADPASLESKF